MMDNNPMGGNYPNPNAYDPEATVGPGAYQNRAQNEAPYGAQPLPPQYAPAGYAGEQTVHMGAGAPPVQPGWQNAPQGYDPYAAPPAPDYGAYAQQPYAQNNGGYAPQMPDYNAYANVPQGYQNAPNNGGYAPQTPNYGAYAYPPQQKKSNSTMYVLIAIMSVCFVAIAALCVYFISDSDEDGKSKTKTPSSSYHSSEPAVTAESTDEPTVPVETESVPTETTTEPTEPPATEPPTTEPPTTEDPYLFLDELNRRYGNYFDFLPDENGYVIADSSSRLISKQELYGMTEHEVCIARNEIYARHGYIFQTEQYNEYFKNFDWYHPTTTTLPTLSEIESENAKVIAAYESERGW